MASPSFEIRTSAGVLTLSLILSLNAIDGKPLEFTRSEERILGALWLACGVPVPAQELATQAGIQSGLAVHVSRLRAKVAGLGLKVELSPGRGYRLVVKESGDSDG